MLQHAESSAGSWCCFSGSLYKGDSSSILEPEPGARLLRVLSIDGPSGLAGLSGSFASCALLDSKLFLVKSRTAGNPLYFSVDTHRASIVVSDRISDLELPLTVLPLSSCDETRWRKEPYLTCVENIFQVPPGHLVCITADGRWNISPYYTIPSSREFSDEAALCGMLRERLAIAVDRLLSPGAAVLISGGIDSAAVALLASRRNSELLTYSVGSKRNNEFSHAALVAEALGTKHSEILFEEQDILDLFVRTVHIVEHCFSEYIEFLTPLLAAVAAIPSKDVLTGYGSDGLFLGVTAFEGRQGPLENIQALEYQSTWWANEFTDGLAEGRDRRVLHPYWDDDFVDLSLSIPVTYKIHEGADKYILRKAFTGLLPEQTAWRPKLGIHQSTGIENHFTDFLGLRDLSPQERRKKKNYFAHAALRMLLQEGASHREVVESLHGML